MTLPQLIEDLGFINKQYKLFSECFEKDAELLRPHEVSSISKMFKKCLPHTIEGSFAHVDELKQYILTTLYKLKTQSVDKNMVLIEKYFPIITAFSIVRHHNEIEKYPQLMVMRNIIMDAKEIVRLAAKGANTGNRKYAEVMQTNVRSFLANNNVAMVPLSIMFAINEYLTKKAIMDSDPDAIHLLKNYLGSTQPLLPQ